MRTPNRPALFLSFVLATASGTASAGTMVLEDGYQTPPSTLVIEDGFATPAAEPGFDQRIESVRAGLRTAGTDAQCAPAALELRLQRRLRRVIAVLGMVLRADSASEATARLAHAAALHRGYCEAVRASAGLRPECAARLRLPCPTTTTQQ